MTEPIVDILTIDRGSVVAPAGTGKTQLIASALERHNESKPILVLTHTNAGVAALRERFDRAGVQRTGYRLSTIDGWAIRLARTFPMRSGIDAADLDVDGPKPDYPGVRRAIFHLLASRHVSAVMLANFARVVVDEYQDCSVLQHGLVSQLADVLPTCVLGDPLQAIFDFDEDGLPDWERDVCSTFPVAGELSRPWRWINTGQAALGDWLGDVRTKLIDGDSVDLRSAPSSVRWIQLSGRGDHQSRRRAASTAPPDNADRVMIIADSQNTRGHGTIAKSTWGAETIDAVELKDLVKFAQSFNVTDPGCLDALIDFAATVMTNVDGATLKRRVATLMRGNERRPPSAVEQAAVAFARDPSNGAASALLAAMRTKPKTRVYRPTTLRACERAFALCSATSDTALVDEVLTVRDQYRMRGRRLPRRAVGSTLLLKGLEAEVAVVLDAEGLDTRNLYVAITRGSRALVICSQAPILKPLPPARTTAA